MQQKIDGLLVPKLRFPEFRDAPEWEEKRFHQIAQPVSEKAKGTDAEAALTLSAEHGIISQGDYFGKKIAGENTDRYIKIALNDFVYNDRTTKLFTYGTIKRLSKYQSGLVSPIYKCFRFKVGENPVFWEWYFESGIHEPQLHSLINEGARAGRFNISIQKFLSALSWSPKSDEQQKIADCLSSISDRITLEAQKLDTLKIHKKGLMQQLFPAEGETLPKLRFPEFQDSRAWEVKELFQVCQINPSINNLPETFVYIDLESVESGNLLQKKVISREGAPSRAQRLLKRDDVIFQMVRSYQRNNYYFDANEDISYVASTGYAQLRAHESSLYLFQYLHNDNFVERVLAKCTGSNYPAINSSDLSKILVEVPSLPEQQKIADCLSSLDELIAAQAQAINTLKTHKKGLMQQLFPSVEEEKG